MLDPKYIPLFIGGFIAWICFMIFVGWITSRGKNEGSSFLTGGGNLGFFLIFCTVGATMIGTGSSMGAIGNGFNHGWGGAIYGLGASAGILSMLLFTKAKNKGFLTMSEEAQYYYGGKKDHPPGHGLYDVRHRDHLAGQPPERRCQVPGLRHPAAGRYL